MSERDNESFDLDDEFLGGTEDSTDYDRLLQGVEKRVRPQPGVKRGKAAWSKLEEVLAELQAKREMLHVVITGRNAKQALIDMADLVTEMTMVKHPYRSGVKAQRGIEF